MDRVSESLLREFSIEHGIAHLPEDKRFEHFACAITIGRHYSDSFDTEDVLVGTAPGIDGIAIIVNNNLITDVDGLDEVKDDQQWDVSFIFVQADRGAGFDAGKMSNIGFAVVDFFKEAPTLPRTTEVIDAATIMAKLYEQSVKFKPANDLSNLLRHDGNLDIRRDPGGQTSSGYRRFDRNKLVPRCDIHSSRGKRRSAPLSATKERGAERIPFRAKVDYPRNRGRYTGLPRVSTLSGIAKDSCR